MIAAILAAQAAPVPQTAPASPAQLEPKAYAPSADTCADPAACRHVDAVVLNSPTSGQMLRLPVNRTVPWLPQSNILLFPGESVIVRMKPEGDRLVPILVKGGEAAISTELRPEELRFRFYQDKDGALMLRVDSRYPEPLAYVAVVNNIARGPHKTSVCTLLPGKDEPKFNLERWPEPISQIALANFHVTMAMGCS